MTVRLTEVPTGRVVSTEKIDGRVEGIFEIQDRLATSIAERLNLESPTPTLEPSAPPKLEAYEAYARGRRLWFRLEKGSFEQAGELYAQAVQADPDHAPALSGLAALHAMRFTFTTDPQELQAAVRDAVTLQRDLHDREEEESAAIIRAAGGEIIELTPDEQAAFVKAVAPIYAEARATYSPELLSLVNL